MTAAMHTNPTPEDCRLGWPSGMIAGRSISQRKYGGTLVKNGLASRRSCRFIRVGGDISMSPSIGEVDDTFKELFPSLVGVNISYHLPSEATDAVHRKLKEHAAKRPSRMQGILRGLTERLKSDPALNTGQAVKHYLEEELEKLEAQSS